MKSTIFLTGAAGFIGRAIVRRARFAGADRIEPVSHSYALPQLRQKLTAAADGPLALIHAAWPPLSGVKSADEIRRRQEEWRIFSQWSLRLREIALETQTPFIGIGSGVEAYVADGRLTEPYLSYARNKHSLCRRLKEMDPASFSWLRLHFLFGPHENPNRFVPAAITACQSGNEFSCGSRERRRCWLSVDETADLLIEFALTPAPGIWDVAARHDLSFNELLDLIEKAVGKSLRLTPDAPATADSALSSIAPTNLAPNVPVEAGRADFLLDRLRNYAQWIDRTRSKSTQKG